MKFQTMLITMAVGMCIAQPIQREQRKFIYQEGHPSVRRYPVYPDRMLNSDQDTSTSGRDKPVLSVNQIPNTEAEKAKDREVEPVTDSFLASQPETTTPGRPTTYTTTTTTTTTTRTITTTQRPMTEELTTPEGFSFTPKSSSLFENVALESGFQPFAGFPISPEDLPGPLFGDAPKREPVPSSAFGIFTDVPAEAEMSTDMSLTTDMPNDIFGDEDRSSSSSSSSSTVMPEEEDEAPIRELNESTTDSAMLEEAVTESAWDAVTQEIYPTEETEVF